MDKHPKRRKSKDNPYKISISNNRYLISFKSSDNKLNEFEITKEVYETFNKFELEDISQMHKDDKHKSLFFYDYSETIDNYIFNNSMYEYKSVEKIVEEKIINEKLKNAINQLSTIQKRRVIMYYFEDMNFKEIARIEHCDESSIRESIHSGIKKIRKILK